MPLLRQCWFPILAAWRGALAAVVLLACVAVVRAELPVHRLDRVAPLGGPAGETVEVELAGGELDEVRELLFDHAGLSAAPVEGKPRRFAVAIAPDVPAGTYDLRAVGRFGVSNPRLFAVTQGLAAVLEQEPNNEPAQAQPLAVNAVAYGTSDGNGEDWYRVTLRAGQRVTIACESARLDTQMDADLTLLAADGRPLASSGDYLGRDPLIDFQAPADGDYVVSVSDLSFRGGYPYRLVVSDRPHVENVFPRVVRRGQANELTALGRNLGGAASAWTEGDLPLEELRFSVTPPDDVWDRGLYRFVEHPTDHSVLPTAATCTLLGYQVQPPARGALANPVPVVLTDLPVTWEQEPNDDRAAPQQVSLPLMLAGRFDRPRDADWFAFEAPHTGRFALDVYCERIAGRADPYVVLYDDKDNRVQELDDFGHRVNAFDGHLRDPSGTVNLQEKRVYRLLVQDRYRRGGARQQYVLALRPADPDFHVAVIHSQNPGPGALNVWRGGAAHLDVVLHRRDGFQGEITLRAEGLPPGVHAAPTTLQQGNSGAFVVWADDDAAEWTGSFRIVAEARVGDAVIRREVRPYTRVSNESSSRPTREVALAVRESAPYALAWGAERVEIVAGQKGEVPLRLARRWSEFAGEVNVLPTSWPGHIKPQLAKFSSGETERATVIEIGANAPPGEYTIAVLGQAQVPYNKDPQAKERANTLVTLPSRPLTIVVVPPAMP